jgi:uncharacterized membrane protein YccC
MPLDPSKSPQAAWSPKKTRVNRSKAFRLALQIWTAGGAILAFVISAGMTFFYGFLADGANVQDAVVQVIMLTLLGAVLGATIAGLAGLFI